jgi:hypothetical protein
MYPQHPAPLPDYTSGTAAFNGIWNQYSNNINSPKLSYDSPRYKLTPERATPLQKWFDEHRDHPYPTRHDKIVLCQETNLTFTQVSCYPQTNHATVDKIEGKWDPLRHFVL